MANSMIARLERMKTQVENQRKSGQLSEAAYKTAVAGIDEAIRQAGILPTRERGTTQESVREYAKLAKLSPADSQEVEKIISTLDSGVKRLRDLLGKVEVDITDGKNAGSKGKPTPRWFCNVVPMESETPKVAKK